MASLVEAKPEGSTEPFTTGGMVESSPLNPSNRPDAEVPMRLFLKQLLAPAAFCGVVSTVLPALAQTPTFAPSNPLVAPGEPLSSPSTPSTIPQSVTPPSTIPQSTPDSTIPGGTYSVPGNTFSVPSGNPVDPPATIVTPGTVVPAARPWGAWYPGYWLGFRPNDPPFGGGPVPYRTNYQGYALPPGAGGCNSCQPNAPIAPMAPCGTCGPLNLDFGRGYDGFMTGW